MRERALTFLRTALRHPGADFRGDQWESIEAILAHKRVFVVQRTGWGKSMVYFLATRLLRDQGAGPTLLVSPLLSLMRNQIEAAQRIGLNAETINSSNLDDWDGVIARLTANQIDLLLISPERLANEIFRRDVLTSMVNNIGLLVVDEAHCISDWGHDFRPDYRRIVRVLNLMPPNVPVLATTATANNRVVADVQAQLGDHVDLIRGSLVRKSLRLQNINMPSPAERMAWLAKTIPEIEGSGIVYALTQRDVERITEWLQINDINAKAYHAGISDTIPGGSARETLEQELLNNEIKVLVATVALGMGFDKPDLGFVIHFQRPSSVVHYYQQVGRAGRAVDNAYGVLLCGEEDDSIADFFIRNAFPPQQHVNDILTALNDSDGGLSVPSLEKVLNIQHKKIEKALKFLTVEMPSPIVKIKSNWHVTATASTYSINQQHVAEITAIRRSEQKQMREYMEHQGCLMAFLQSALDDPTSGHCGKCRNCAPSMALAEEYDMDLANRAGLFLRRNYQRVFPRKRWPAHQPFSIYDFSGSIKETLGAKEGRALSLWRDAGWGELVAKGKYTDGRFADELVTACAEMLKAWKPVPDPEWVTCIPSTRHPELVMDFAERLAKTLGIPFVNCMAKIKENRQQKEMENSFQQARNLDGVFEVTLKQGDYAPCLLVDDVVDSNWTFTVAAALLRQVGCVAVYPMALAMNAPRKD